MCFGVGIVKCRWQMVEDVPSSFFDAVIHLNYIQAIFGYPDFQIDSFYLSGDSSRN